MKKNFFNFLYTASTLSIVLFACSKKDAIDNTPLPCTQNIAPANGAELASLSVTLSWSPIAGAAGYDVYVGASADNLVLVSANVAGTSFSYTLPSNISATYYWYVVPKKNDRPAGNCSSAVTSFSFRVGLGNTTNVSPANGSGVASDQIILKWNKVSGAAGYDVYLGASAAGATLIAGNIADTSYTFTVPAGTLSSTYYWYVSPKNSSGNAQNSISTATSFRYVFITAPPSLDFLIIGYFPSYKNVDEYPDRMFKMCNIVNYAFAAVNSSSDIDIAVPAALSAVYTKAKANGAKVFLSVNATLSNFTLLKDAAKRNTLVRSIMSKTRELNLDGVDMDYEYPRTTDGTDTIFALLVKELSDSLHTDGRYYLSAAITPGRYAGAVRDGIKDEVFNYVDFFNVMVYDDFSTTVLYKHHSNMDLVNYCMNYWLNTRNMPKQKFVLGIPVYGRNSGAAQIATSYKTILKEGAQLGPAPVALSDSATLTRTDGSTFTTYYTGQTTAKQKATVAKSNAGGIMFWEIGHDANDDNSIIKAACDAIGRNYN